MSVADLINDLLSTEKGFFVACNIVDAVEQKILDRSNAKEAILFCDGLYNVGVRDVRSDSVRQLKTCALFHKAFLNKKLRFMANDLPSIGSNVEDVCWVASFKILAKHYVNFSKVCAHFDFSDDTNCTVDNIKAAIYAICSAEVEPATIMRGEIETWWHTKNEPFFDKLNEKGVINQADRARDWLGLIHHAEGTALVAITIPGDVLARAHSLKRPTFAEAGPHPRFRSWTLSANLGWGHAVNLEALIGASVATEGGEERVASPIPFPELDAVKAEFLGVVSETHEEACSDCVFLPLMLRGRSEAMLRTQLHQLAA